MVALRRAYLLLLGKPRGISQAISRYNDARDEQTLRIATSADLYGYLRNALDTDVRRWIEEEGAYELILGRRVYKAKKQEYEKLVQKTLKTQIESILQRRGFHVDVIREPQLLDEKRPDFLVHYGFAGPVVLEVKLTSNKDVRRTNVTTSQSYESMKRYMDGFGASHGLFVAIGDGDARPLPKIQKAFEQIPGVAVIAFDIAKNTPRASRLSTQHRKRPSKARVTTRRPRRKR
jgi:hypothetical protein